MGASKIQWTDRTWNPVRGCSRVSKGCENCYAERFAARFSDEGKPFHGFARNMSRRVGPQWTGRVELIPDKLDAPLHWRKPSRVFVNSMSDLFHENLPDDDIFKIWTVMFGATQHTFQILTKRPERMLAFVKTLDEPFYSRAAEKSLSPLPNVWLGVSVEDQKTADERIPLLLQTPAAVRFVSYEPALGPVDFGGFLSCLRCNGEGSVEAPGGGTACPACFASCQGSPHRGPYLDWLIIGGESGPGARMCDVAWIRSAMRQARKAGAKVFVKQLGANCGEVSDHRDWFQGRQTKSAEEAGYQGVRRLRDPKGGDPAEWPEDLRVREFPP